MRGSAALTTSSTRAGVVPALGEHLVSRRRAGAPASAGRGPQLPAPRAAHRRCACRSAHRAQATGGLTLVSPFTHARDTLRAMTTPAATYDALDVGDEAPPLVVENLTRTNFVRYAGASGDFNPMHHDDTIATRSATRRSSATGCSPPGSWRGW